MMLDPLGTNDLTDIYTITFKAVAPGRVRFDLTDDRIADYADYTVVTDEIVISE